jgi:hypothetical protein
MLLTIAAEFACTGNRSTRLFQWLERGKIGHFLALGRRLPCDIEVARAPDPTRATHAIATSGAFLTRSP